MMSMTSLLGRMDMMNRMSRMSITCSMDIVFMTINIRITLTR